MKTRVLDSWAILEWISGRQPGADIVAKLLSEAEDGRTRLFLSAINAGEVYYFLRRQHSEALALAWRESCGTLPVTAAVATADEIWNAAELNGRFPIGFAGAFAAALAQRYHCPLVTGDPEFGSVESLELDWIGRGG